MNYNNPNGYQPQPGEVPMSQPPIQEVPPINNSVNFMADANVLGLIQMVHPELRSAMINLAIKKFAENPDFANYFVIEQFKSQLQAVAQSEQLPNSSNSNNNSTNLFPSGPTPREIKKEPIVSQDFTVW